MQRHNGWTTAEVQRVQRMGYEDGLAEGARGRGSRARYRRAVVDAIAWLERDAAGARGFLALPGVSLQDPTWVADVRRRLKRVEPAIRRARRILDALDGVRS